MDRYSDSIAILDYNLGDYVAARPMSERELGDEATAAELEARTAAIRDSAGG